MDCCYKGQLRMYPETRIVSTKKKRNEYYLENYPNICKCGPSQRTNEKDRNKYSAAVITESNCLWYFLIYGTSAVIQKA